MKLRTSETIIPARKPKFSISVPAIGSKGIAKTEMIVGIKE